MIAGEAAYARNTYFSRCSEPFEPRSAWQMTDKLAAANVTYSRDMWVETMSKTRIRFTYFDIFMIDREKRIAPCYLHMLGAIVHILYNVQQWVDFLSKQKFLINCSVQNMKR